MLLSKNFPILEHSIIKLENVYELEMNFLFFYRFETVPRYYRGISFQISAFPSKFFLLRY
jgi:hypothetical protein